MKLADSILKRQKDQISKGQLKPEQVQDEYHLLQGLPV